MRVRGEGVNSSVMREGDGKGPCTREGEREGVGVGVVGGGKVHLAYVG